MAVTWKDHHAAQHFVDQRRHMPGFDLLFEAAARLVGAARPHRGHEPRHIIDLGCGSGALGGALGMLWPAATLTLADNSPPMLDLAAQRHGDAANTRIVEADLNEPGVMERLVDAPVDAVVSSMAIHHLPRARQRALYGEVFDALTSGGVFVNVEHTASACERTERIGWQWFYDRIAHSRRASGEDVTAEDVRREFEPRQEINVLTSVQTQCDWLRAIGYRDVDCVVKVFEMAVFGGYTPPGPAGA
jgi:SAM-dependent methyltransferase